jgi:site-specific DNA-methyltransferase (adenine-specific)
VSEVAASEMIPYYEKDGITIYHGEALDILANLPSGSVDALLTDPPYSSGGMFRADRVGEPSVKYRGWSQSSGGKRRPPTADYGSFGGDNKDQWAWIRWITWSMQCLRIVRNGGHGFMFTDWRQLPAATDAAQFGGWSWRGLLVWDKGSARPIRGQFRNHLEYIVWMVNGAIDPQEDYPSALIQVPTVGAGERQHVTQKPVSLIHHLLRVLPPGQQTVIDPFMGSGSTLVAVAEAGHRAIGIDVEERYCEMAASRLSQGVIAL